MSSVNVLCPNGRRQTVKVTPNSTCLQIIEETCLKRGFDADRHDLKHGRKTLDVSLTFRFLGLPNNAKLDLVERESPRNLTSEVTIALQLPLDGERRQKTISSESSLADMVKSFQKDAEDLLHISVDTNQHPIIVYMRDEVIGLTALQHITLRSIGLISGKAALRLVYRAVDKQTLLQITSQINAEKDRQAKLLQSRGIEEQQSALPTISPLTSISEVVNTNSCDGGEITGGSHKAAGSSVKDTRECESMDCSQDTWTCAVVKSEHTTPNLPHTTPNVSKSLAAKSALKGSSPQADMEVKPKVCKIEQQLPPPTPLSDFKFPEETAGMDLYRNELSDVETSDYQPCDRESIVYSLMESTTAPSLQLTSSYSELPDDFFEVTKDDLVKMMHDLRNQIAQDETAPLMTSSMRIARQEAAYSKYKFCIIRFYFPDKMVLQARFKPRETVHSLNKFIQNHIKDKSQSFYLYVTPPKQTLSDTALTLIQANLVPMAIVHVGFNNVEAEPGSCLGDEIIALKGTRVEADEHARMSLPVQAAITDDGSHKITGNPRSLLPSGDVQVSTRSDTRRPAAANKSSADERRVPK